MSTSFETSDLERFRVALSRRFGLFFDDGKLTYLATVLDRRLSTSGAGTEGYLDRMEGAAPPRDELRELARELTVGETYFFRHMAQFRAFADVALPDRISANSEGRHLRLLSAGCASGDEAYSLAILVRERALDPRWNVAIHAVDLNPAVLEKADCARYSAWSLRETPSEIQRRWFLAEGRELVLDQAIRSAVTFEERNLAQDDPTF